jgi:hypothetical protein
MRKYQIQLGGAVCVPQSCSPQKIRSFVNEYLANADLKLSDNHPLSEWCMTNEKPPLEIIDWICL